MGIESEIRDLVRRIKRLESQSECVGCGCDIEHRILCPVCIQERAIEKNKKNSAIGELTKRAYG